MITEDNKDLLSKILTQSNPTLFLGAGFSIGSISTRNTMDGTNLKEYIYVTYFESKKDELELNEENLIEIKNYDLRKTCETLYYFYGDEAGKKLLSDLLVECYSDIRPGKNKFHLKLTKYPWRKIFTVNIDDLVENIYRINKENLFVQNNIKLKEETEDVTVLYKLHGCVNQPDEGFIFSDSDYSKLISKKLDAKSNLFVQEVQNNDIIFIGARMDEPDIRYYLQVYENAGCKYRTNKIVFIDPFPTLNLKTIANKLGAVLIESTTEEFLNFIEELKYCPSAIENSLISLNYNGIYRLSDLEKTYNSPYESKLYFGNNCTWQDVYDGWIFEIAPFKKAVEVLDELISLNHSVSCLCIYGPFFVGKSCLLKNLGYYLSSKSFEVLEYRGINLNIRALKDYIEKSLSKEFVLIIDNAAYYYERLEKLLLWNCAGKRLVIIAASRTYYHKRKKYYLIGKSFREYELAYSINIKSAEVIRNKLDEKSHLSYLSSYSPDKQMKSITKKRTIINLIIDLTYGKISNRIKEEYQKCLPLLTDQEQLLLLELAVFDRMDIEYYPRSLFSEKYGKTINFDSDINISEMGIVDWARMDEKGISLRNSLIIENMINQNKAMIPNVISDILAIISRNVEERKSDVWYYIFSSLLKEDMLKERLKLSYKQIESIFLSVKSDYKDKSYYWLQMGILFQKKKDFASAHMYLQQSYSIRPNSYQIQHALARNYLKDANNNNNQIEALVAFEAGEKMMKELINSTDFYKEKAKAFSVTCYIAEKIRFITKFNLTPSNQDLRFMIESLESIEHHEDEYVKNTFVSLYDFLKKHDKSDLFKLKLNSPFYKCLMNKSTLNKIEDNEDPIIESYI